MIEPTPSSDPLRCDPDGRSSGRGERPLLRWLGLLTVCLLLGGCLPPTLGVASFAGMLALLSTAILTALVLLGIGAGSGARRILAIAVHYYWTMTLLMSGLLVAQGVAMVKSVEEREQGDRAGRSLFTTSALAAAIAAVVCGLSAVVWHFVHDEPVAWAWFALAAFAVVFLIYLGFNKVSNDMLWLDDSNASRRIEWLDDYLESGGRFGDRMVQNLFVLQFFGYTLLLLSPAVLLTLHWAGYDVGRPTLADAFSLGLLLFGLWCIGYVVVSAVSLTRVFTTPTERSIEWDDFLTAFAAGYRERTTVLFDRLHTLVVGAACLLPVALATLPELTVFETTTLFVLGLVLLIGLAGLFPFYDGQSRQIESSLAAVRAANDGLSEERLLEFRRQLEKLGPPIPLRALGRAIGAILGFGGLWAYACRQYIAAMIAP